MIRSSSPLIRIRIARRDGDELERVQIGRENIHPPHDQSLRPPQTRSLCSSKNAARACRRCVATRNRHRKDCRSAASAGRPPRHARGARPPRRWPAGRADQRGAARFHGFRALCFFTQYQQRHAKGRRLLLQSAGVREHQPCVCEGLLHVQIVQRRDQPHIRAGAEDRHAPAPE